MKRLVFALALLPSVAAADWKIETFTNRMTDKKDVVAWVETSGARLQIECMDAPLVGGLVVSLVSDKIRPGMVGLNYRIDQGPVETRIVPARSGGGSVLFMHGAPVEELKRAKRLRVEIVPGPFYDFNVSGGEKARVPCVNRRLAD
jgi:hypothetical protein